MSDSELAARVRRLEDIEALKQLKHRYAAFCDQNYDPDGLAPLFTDNAIWDGGAMGRYEGREAIRTFFSEADKVVPFAIHHVTNPIIEVDGDRAAGRWYLWQPCIFSPPGEALWMAGRYFDKYRREEGVWRFEHVQIELRMLSPYEAGWARLRMMEMPNG
jgi:SnoaL-like domain